jgi:hypothetical protein
MIRISGTQGETRNAFRILVGISHGKRPLLSTGVDVLIILKLMFQLCTKLTGSGQHGMLGYCKQTMNICVAVNQFPVLSKTDRTGTEETCAMLLA